MNNRMRGLMKRLYRVSGLALLLAGALPAGAWEDTEAAIAEWCKLSTDFETPHTPWGRPSAQGRLRVLYFIGSPHEGIDVRVREAVEFRQRFDAEVEVVYWTTFFKADWFGGVAGKRRLARLLTQPWDLFVFQDVSPDGIPDWPDIEGRVPHTSFIEAVKNGTGVVMTGCDSATYLKDRVPAAEPPAFLAGVPVESLSTFGKGHVVKLAVRPLIAYRPGWEWRYDRWQEQFGRTALYAARREPSARLAIEVPPEFARAGLPAPALALAWSGLGASSATCEAWLRRDDGERIALGNAQPATGGAGKAVFTLPELRAGEYTIYGLLTSDRGREAWAAGMFKVTAPSCITEIAVTSGARLPFLQVDKKERQEAMEERLGTHLPYFEVGQSIEGTVTVESAAGQRLRIELLDFDGRILHRQEAPAGATAGATSGAPAAFRYPVENLLPMGVRIRATLIDGDGEVAAAETICRVVKRHRDRFNFVLWGGPADSTLAPYALQTLKRMGVTAIYDRFPPSLAMATYGMTAVPFTGGNVNASQAEGWNDPESARFWVNHVGRARSHGALAYSLGDEGATSGHGRGPKTIAAWQAYLDTEYPDIAALNRSWGSSFTNTGAITELGFTPPPAPATPLPNHAPAFDLAAFSGYNFVQMARIHVNRLREERNDPEAVIGFEGSGDFKRTLQAEQISRELGMWVPYSGYIDEFLRGAAPRPFLRSVWMGYHQTADGHCGRYYYGLVNGADSAWYWMWSTMGAWQGFQKPDLAGGVPAIEEFVADTRFVREGLGDLLLKYEMQTDGITLFHSEASNWLSGQKESPLDPYGPYTWVHMTWATAIHDLALQYDYVSDRGIRAGEWDPGKTKVLILSSAFALSTETAAAIRRYVENGGVVIADFRPGFYDHHCRPHDPTGQRAILDDLFGIRGAFPPKAEEAVNVTINGELGGVPLALSSPNAEYAGKPLADPGIQPTTAKALGQAGNASVVFVNTVGKGKAVLLNMAMWSVTTMRQETPNMTGQGGSERTPYPFGVFLLDLFKAVGVQPAVEIAPYKNETKRRFVGNVRVQRWKNGENEIMAVFRQTGIRETEEKWVNISRFDGRRYVYDIRHGIPVGYGIGGDRNGVPGSWWLSDLVPARASFFALTPGELQAPHVELAAAAKRGTRLALKVRVPGAKGLHALRLRVRTPEGRPFEPWEQTVLTDAAGTSVPLPLAVNDPAGRWELTVTDSFSTEAVTRRILTVE